MEYTSMLANMLVKIDLEKEARYVMIIHEKVINSVETEVLKVCYQYVPIRAL